MESADKGSCDRGFVFVPHPKIAVHLRTPTGASTMLRPSFLPIDYFWGRPA